MTNANQQNFSFLLYVREKFLLWPVGQTTSQIPYTDVRQTASKKFSKQIGQTQNNFPYINRSAESASEMEVLQMQTDMSEETRQANAEAIDTLIAISVVAKVLAEKLRKETKEGESNE